MVIRVGGACQNATMPQNSTMPSLWRNRPYVYLLSGETVSSFGAMITHVALPITAVTYLAATEFQVGVLGAAESAAFLFLALPAGAWVDRMSHRRVMIAANIARSGLLGLIPLAWALHILSIGWLMWVALGVGVCRVFFDVAYMSIVPSLVPKAQLTEANSRLQATLEVANIAGPSAGGFLAKVVSAPLLPLASVIGFVSSAFAIWRIPEPVVTRSEAPRHLRREIREGVEFVWHQPLIRPVVLAAMTSNLFGTIAFTMFPVLALREFGLGSGAYGLIMTAGSFGAITGALLGPILARRFGEGHAVPMATIASGVFAFVVPCSFLVPRPVAPYVLGLGSFLMLVGIVAFNITQVSLRQRVCPPRLLGRMNATIRFAIWGVMPVSALLSGAIASAIGLAATFWIGAVGELLSAAFVVFSPLWGLKTIQDYDEAATVEGMAEVPPPVL